MKQRLLQLFELKGVKNATVFAKMLNYPSHEKISRLFRDDNAMPSADILRDIANLFEDVDINYLLTGKGSIIRNNAIAIQSLSGEGIPLIPIEAIAGLSNQTDYSIEFKAIEDRYVIPLFSKAADFLIYVRGNSMFPRYNSGDVVACKFITDQLYIQWGKIYVIDTHTQGVMIKRILQSKQPGNYVFKSDNIEFPDFEVPISDIRNLAIVLGGICIE